MDAGLVSSLHRTSSIQGLLGQHLSSSQLSFSSSVALPAAERFCPGSLQDNLGLRAASAAARPSLGLGLGGALAYEGPYGKWSLSGKKGFNGPAAAATADGDGIAQQSIRMQVSSTCSIHPCSIKWLSPCLPLS